MLNFRKSWTTDLHSISLTHSPHLTSPHLTFEQHTPWDLWPRHTPRFTHRSRFLVQLWGSRLTCSAFIQSGSWHMCDTSSAPSTDNTRLWTRYRNLCACIVCIWKFGLDHPIADRPHLFCPLPYLAPALVHHYSWIMFWTIVLTKCLHFTCVLWTRQWPFAAGDTSTVC